MRVGCKGAPGGARGCTGEHGGLFGGGAREFKRCRGGVKETCVAKNSRPDSPDNASVALAGLVKLRRPAAIAASSTVARVNVAVATTEPAAAVTLTHSGPARPT